MVLRLHLAPLITRPMSSDSSDLSNAWQQVRDSLGRLTGVVESAANGPVDLMRFADEFGVLARAYLAALTLQGKTSMRMESVVRALDLKTPKSALERFLGRVP